ncbi:MAG: MmcQ/YjbR family DNA-binding protein [Coprobacter sp.]|nr:MmcQ/YjbR family DNA-binding protein [Coprobacter sp.]
MNIEEFRDYTLSLDGVTEKMPFGKAASPYDRGLLVFSVADKWFALVNVDQFDFCTLKSRPDDTGQLRARYDIDIRPGWHMNKKHWISVTLNSSVPDSEIRRLVRASYDIVVASLTPRERKQFFPEK